MPNNTTLRSLLNILYIEKKIELVKYCKDAEIHSSDFAALVFAAELGEIPWQHRISYRDFFPEHLDIVGVNFHLQKGRNKFSQFFKERRYLVGHMFYSSDIKNWHLFYFDQRDLSDRDNHWEHGSHIHLINHLWPNHDAQSLWTSFNSGNPKMSGSLHIKYIGRGKCTS